jgi:hypothetical protein
MILMAVIGLLLAVGIALTLWWAAWEPVPTFAT